MENIVRRILRQLLGCLYRRATALTAVSTAVVFLYSQVASPLAQASFWAERQKAVKTYQATHDEQANTPTLDDTTVAAASSDPAKATQLLAALPGPQTSVLQGLPANITPNMLPKPSLPPEVSPAVLQRYPLLGELPLAFGSLKDIQLAPGHVQRPLIIHLQDVHLNPEAQLNLASILRTVLEQGKVGVVGIEAAHGPFNFQPFRAFPDPAITKDVANYLLNQGDLGAGSYVGITAREDYSDKFYGVDHPAHYRANVEAVKRSKALQPSYQARLKALQTTIIQLKAGRFNPALRTFEAQVSAYREGTLGLGAYVEALVAQGVSVQPNMEQFLATYHQEKALDFAAVEEERKALIEQLVPKLDQPTLSQLVAHSVAYRMEQITYATYYRYLQGVCANYGIDLKRYPAMQAYVQYVLQADRINAETLFRELADTEETALTKLTQSPEERQLLMIAKQLGLIGQLVNLGLTPEQWTSWQKVRISLEGLEQHVQAFERGSQIIPSPLTGKDPHPTLRVGLSPDGRGKGVISPLPSEGEGQGEGAITDLTPFERFYLEAEARDDAMVANLLARMKTVGASTGVLLAGGFHASGIARRMKEQQVSYVSLAPKITKLDTADGTKYLDVFVREKTPLEKLFTGEKLFLANEGVAGVGAVLMDPATPKDPSIRYGFLETVFNVVHGVIRKTFGPAQSRRLQQAMATVLLSVGLAPIFSIGPVTPKVDADGRVQEVAVQMVHQAAGAPEQMMTVRVKVDYKTTAEIQQAASVQQERAVTTPPMFGGETLVLSEVKSIPEAKRFIVDYYPYIPGLEQVHGFFADLPLIKFLLQSAVIVAIISVSWVVINKLLRSRVALNFGQQIPQQTEVFSQVTHALREIPTPPVRGRPGGIRGGVVPPFFGRVLGALSTIIAVLVVFVASNSFAFALDQSYASLMYTVGLVDRDRKRAIQVLTIQRRHAAQGLLTLLEPDAPVTVEAGSGGVLTDHAIIGMAPKIPSVGLALSDISTYAKSLDLKSGLLAFWIVDRIEKTV
ncbi:MAG: hypothetical protein HYZ73_08080, partial [Elusimicrobia bacterium]|nr:hypothetical protein [Elusimicrobiota bacterium]